MPTNVVMPQMGESIAEGTIVRWIKKVGDTVDRDEPLFEISTDKVDTEVPSPVAGTVSKILVQEGATVPVGTAVMEIDDGTSGAAASGEASGAPAGLLAWWQRRPDSGVGAGHDVGVRETPARVVDSPCASGRVESRCARHITGQDAGLDWAWRDQAVCSMGSVYLLFIFSRLCSSGSRSDKHFRNFEGDSNESFEQQAESVTTTATNSDPRERAEPEHLAATGIPAGTECEAACTAG